MSIEITSENIHIYYGKLQKRGKSFAKVLEATSIGLTCDDIEQEAWCRIVWRSNNGLKLDATCEAEAERVLLRVLFSTMRGIASNRSRSFHSKYSVCDADTSVVAVHFDESRTEAARPNQLTRKELDDAFRRVFETASLSLLEHRAFLVTFQRLKYNANESIEAGYERGKEEAWRKAQASARDKLKLAISDQLKSEIEFQSDAPYAATIRAAFVDAHEERFALQLLSKAALSTDQLKCAVTFLGGGSIGNCEEKLGNALFNAGLLGFFRSWWYGRNFQLLKAAQKLLNDASQ